MNPTAQDRNSLILMLSVILFLLLSAFLAEAQGGEVVAAISVFAVLIAATVSLSEERSLRGPATILAGLCTLLLILDIVHPAFFLRILGWMALAGFFGFVSVELFSYLGRGGAITSGRLYASVSLYFILGTFFYAVFNLVEVWHPGSFAESGAAQAGPMHRHKLLYFSLVTLTTLGYGDIVPVKEPARILAALEAAAGVLYIAITVARLVAAYQRTDADRG